jgi:hypothetical protein
MARILVAGSVFLGILRSSAVHAASCETLKSLSLPDTTMTAAETVAAGSFTWPEARPGTQGVKNVPQFCRVRATPYSQNTHAARP